ncbi:MAG: hypothetical protein IKU37_09595 [Candidatus Gastranaerophilales bacterium]|nr:hypothetical protein [Candidatus Gastranaerophilales bacterium]
MNNSAFALDAEFKNSLMKIEVIKTADSNYNLDLYTKNKFVGPVKVIKKSDLNYYVLLPETKNESVRTITQGNDIRSISANVYPYAGQDVDNGYVKININTTRPINFKVNVKSPMAAATIDTKVAQAIAQENPQENLEKNIEKKLSAPVQKKNSDFSISKKSESIKKTISEVTSKKEVPKTYAELFKIEDAVQKEVERVREETMQEVEEELASLEQITPIDGNKELIAQEDLNEIEQIVNGEKRRNVFYSKLSVLKSKISNKLAQYGIEFNNFAMFVLSILFSIMFVCFLFIKKDKQAKKLKKKFELNDPLHEANEIQEESCETKNDGQYFIFDKNIKQTGFCDPATSAIKRNYELSSYEPELKNKYNRNGSFKKNNVSEYDIIQKILKEDTIIDLPNGSFEQQVRTGQLKMQEPMPKKAIAPQVKQEVQKQKVEKCTPEPKKEALQQNIEPEVLSSVEIAPQRGFMLVSYDDNINLVGYIFDDVFALYNFKQPKLEKYDIKYRLSEKDDKIARFIVKVEKIKMLVAVSKTSMELEVIL